MTAQLAQALNSAALLGAVIRPLIVAAILFGLWKALARAELSRGRRLLAWSTVAAVLIGWMAIVWSLAARGFFVPTAGTTQFYAAGMIVVPTIVFVGVALTLLMRSKTITAAIDAAPLWWLIAYQAYRAAGFIFLRLWSEGFLPGYFAVPAGIGDIVTGVFAALVVLAFLRESPRATALAYAVNIFGIADLLNAMGMGLLSTLSNAGGGFPLLLYPIVIVPIFGVPLAFIVHCLSIWQLRRRGRAGSTAAVSARIEMLRTA